MTTYVRIGQRRVFRDVRDGDVVWSYELSRRGRATRGRPSSTIPATHRTRVRGRDGARGPLAPVQEAHSDAYIATSILHNRLLMGIETPEELYGYDHPVGGAAAAPEVSVGTTANRKRRR